MDIERLRPLHDFVLVRRAKSDEKSPGGIIIPDNAKEKLTRGTVVAVGPGKCRPDGSRIEPSVKQDDQILFGKYSGNEIEDKLRAALGEEYLVMRDEDIVAVHEG